MKRKKKNNVIIITVNFIYEHANQDAWKNFHYNSIHLEFDADSNVRSIEGEYSGNSSEHLSQFK